MAMKKTPLQLDQKSIWVTHFMWVLNEVCPLIFYLLSKTFDVNQMEFVEHELKCIEWIRYQMDRMHAAL